MVYNNVPHASKSKAAELVEPTRNMDSVTSCIRYNKGHVNKVIEWHCIEATYSALFGGTRILYW